MTRLSHRSHKPRGLRDHDLWERVAFSQANRRTASRNDAARLANWQIDEEREKAAHFLCLWCTGVIFVYFKTLVYGCMLLKAVNFCCESKERLARLPGFLPLPVRVQLSCACHHFLEMAVISMTMDGEDDAIDLSDPNCGITGFKNTVYCKLTIWHVHEM